jgi:hypothetical protein
VNYRNPGSTALTTSVTNTTAAGDNIAATETAGGAALKWITKPFLEDVAFAAVPWVYNIWAKESDAAANASVGFTVHEYTASEQASFLDQNHATELTTSIARVVDASSNATATTVEAGNRLVVKLEVVAVGTMGGSQTVTIDYDGPTAGADGDTFVMCNETIRTNERQLKNGAYPVITGAGQGAFQDAINGINFFSAAGAFKTEPAIQTLLDELAFERDNM